MSRHCLALAGGLETAALSVGKLTGLIELDSTCANEQRSHAIGISRRLAFKFSKLSRQIDLCRMVP